jgi:hypothetical protein
VKLQPPFIVPPNACLTSTVGDLSRLKLNPEKIAEITGPAWCASTGQVVRMNVDVIIVPSASVASLTNVHHLGCMFSNKLRCRQLFLPSVTSEYTTTSHGYWLTDIRSVTAARPLHLQTADSISVMACGMKRQAIKFIVCMQYKWQLDLSLAPGGTST